MSWGRTVSGSAAQVIAQAAAFAASVAEADQKYSAGPIITQVHQAQARAAAGTLEAMVSAHPEGSVFSGSVSASASEGSGSCYLNIGLTVSVPVTDVGEGAETL